jgi:hypothetical protein
MKGLRMLDHGEHSLKIGFGTTLDGASGGMVNGDCGFKILQSILNGNPSGAVIQDQTRLS